jgi:glycerophosphoryl diester phosphodiesterase
MTPTFDLQGHRGARGLKPENTLPSFEVAFDLGVTSVETDVHLTADGVPVLIHDPFISDRLISSLPLAQIRGYRVDGNPDPKHFPQQNSEITPLARMFADCQRIDPWTPPTLLEMFAFAFAYAGDLGKAAAKSDEQRERAKRIRFDLELKRVPFRSEIIGDQLMGEGPGGLEQEVLACISVAKVIERTSVRSFDHRCIRSLREREPRLTGAVLVAGTAPVSPAELARQADAQVYGPDFEFLDQSQVRQIHAAGLRVVPWTVNDPRDWARLLDWGVDGITTDYPDRLAAFLSARGIVF